MNCKPGDLAVIVRPVVPENFGRLVEVVCAASPGERSPDGYLFDPATRGAFWRVRGRGIVSKRESDGRVSYHDEWFASDSALRPIRDNDGEDEILRLVGKPQVSPEQA